MYKKVRKIHLIGVGGIGMSGIARLLLTHGYEVSGSDLGTGEIVRQLESLGARVHLGHRAENLTEAELVVYSSAVREDNPELRAALERQIPAIPRADMLAELMRLKYGIAVAGAHGKTTTTSMIGTILMSAGLDPTIVVGGRMDNFGGTNARLGKSEFMVVEADESDGSFNRLTPSLAVVTNMDREHMEHYQTMAALKKAFLSFLNRVPFYGLNVLCGDDRHLRSLLPKVSRRKVTYGFGTDNHYVLSQYRGTPEGSEFKVTYQSTSEIVKLNAPGRHNALNAVAAFAIADELSVPRAKILEGLHAFQGVQRRFQLRGEKNGVLFIDDYAHHPNEISATLAAARERFPSAKVRVVFQPHRYSRVEDLFDQFSTCFHQCDAVAITDIYAAGEKPVPGITSAALVESLGRNGHPKAIHEPSGSRAIQGWINESAPGDVIFTLGAGDLPNVYRDLF
jgi:UDP-N-acetylmuramate--alanine ligase